MSESQQVRLQQDIVKEINQHQGSTFSERFRNWKNEEILSRVENISLCDTLSQDDLDDVIREAIRDELPEILRSMNQGNI